MTKKTNVQTNLLGRRAFLTEANAEAAIRYQALSLAAGDEPPYVKLHPDGGEVVAAHTDRDGELNITLSTPKGMVALTAAWLRIEQDNPSISLEKLEAILYRETACICAEDVPVMLVGIYEEAGLEPPVRLVREAEEANRELDCR